MLIEILFCAKGKIFVARFDSPREFTSPLALILKMAARSLPENYRDTFWRGHFPQFTISKVIFY